MSSPSDSKSAHSEYEVEIKENITIVKISETYIDKPLTEEQKEKLLQFDEEFILRYTDDDKDYVAAKILGSTTPPLVPSYRPFRNPRRDDRPRSFKRNWSDSPRNDSDKSNSSHKQHTYGYNNDYRR